VLLSSIIIPISVKSIGESCFEGCLSLQNISLSAATEIEKNVFLNCPFFQESFQKMKKGSNQNQEYFPQNIEKQCVVSLKSLALLFNQ
jgi:hypothetical protein